LKPGLTVKVGGSGPVRLTLYMIRSIVAIFLFFCAGFSYAQAWKPNGNKNGIAIYTREVPGSKINALKMESDFDATASQLVAVIMDIKSCTNWLYSTKSCSVVTTVSPSELYYYSEVSFPWPTSNRDFVSHLKVAQDPATKIVTINAENVTGFVPEKKGIVRIYKSVGKWTIRSIAKNKVRVIYELQVEPGGSLPSWLVNMLSEKGPYESFKKLKEEVKKPGYANAQFAFINE
jgi:hypothetical protein